MEVNQVADSINISYIGMDGRMTNITGPNKLKLYKVVIKVKDLSILSVSEGKHIPTQDNIVPDYVRLDILEEFGVSGYQMFVKSTDGRQAAIIVRRRLKEMGFLM